MPEAVGSLQVKICGLTRPEDARHAAQEGASYLGAILTPGFSRSIEPAHAEELMPGGGPVLVAVVVDAGVEAARAAAARAGAGVIQLHGGETPEELAALRADGRWRVWKAVRVRDAEDVRRALERFAGVADGLLLEGVHPRRGGGQGAAFRWEAVAPLHGSFPDGLTFIAAGGLTPLNVHRCVQLLRPDVVDVSSGVEHRVGVKDHAMVSAFLRAARAEGLGERSTPREASA